MTGLFDLLLTATLAAPSEIAALRWGDIDWLHGRLSLAIRLTPVPDGFAVRNAEPPRPAAVGWDTLQALHDHAGLLEAAGADVGPVGWVFPDPSRAPFGAWPAGPQLAG